MVQSEIGIGFFAERHFTIMTQGRLYIVSTPIGNMADITQRALEVLKTVDIIASEDTRETSKVLNHYQITAQQVSYRDQNHHRVAPFILDSIEQGKNIALASDSGTPLVSDPGYKLVIDIINRGLVVEAIPGPSAIIAALTVSGLPTDKFSFLGFLPRSQGDIKALLSTYGALDATLIIYESPYRVVKLLENVLAVLGDRQVCYVNDITKKFEKVSRGSVKRILDELKAINIKGEFVILVGKEGLKNGSSNF